MRKKSILLVDDDRDDHSIFAAALETIEIDAQLSIALDGKHALEVLSDRGSRLPDIIFLDLNMPRMNGKELLQVLRSTDHLKDVPVVIYSTSSYSADINACMAMGAREYMIKHSSFTMFCNALRRTLTEHLGSFGI